MQAPPGRRTLWLGPHARSRHQLSLQFGLDELRFSASYWYGDADLVDLERRFGTLAMERVYFHIAAFTANTLVSLQPTHFDPGPYARHCTRAFWTLWQQLVQGVWAQWRYEHDMPDYLGPEPLQLAPDSGDAPVSRARSASERTLAFFGGGKDSVVSWRLLQDSGADCDTLVYSSSVYGAAAPQHRLCDDALDALGAAPESRRRMWSFDDLVDSPVARLEPGFGASALTAAETPGSLFAVLPLVLAHGYTRVALGHERSADSANLVWPRTRAEVNHQWGKSSECEQLLTSYLREQLVADCRYFSPLKPVHDPLILSMLAEDPAVAPFTHSCNVAKPWCGRCAKCAYVWLGYQAYLPPEVADRTFAGLGNLLDAPENQVWFRQLLGLTEHTPFECVGGVEETVLAFELCRRRGLDGLAMEMFRAAWPVVDVAALTTKYLAVAPLLASFPEELRDPVGRRLRESAVRAHARLARAQEPVGTISGPWGSPGRPSP